MKTKSGWVILGLTVLLGCDAGNTSSGTIVLPPMSAVDESLPHVAHPEYVNWSQFQEKAFVVRKRLVTNNSGTVVVTTKSWLDKKDADRVSVGSQVTVERPNEPILENSENFVSYPATYRLPAGMDEARFALPSAKAKETARKRSRLAKPSLKRRFSPRPRKKLSK